MSVTSPFCKHCLIFLLLLSINVLGQSQSDLNKRDSALYSNSSRVINLSNDYPDACLLLIDSLVSNANNADNIKFYECLKIYQYLVLGKHKEAYAQVKEIKEEYILQQTKEASYWYYYTLADFYATINNFSTALENYNKALAQATTDN
ncbi:MAG: tetratricopeptide (TPR) repeat protein, partial [Limisphaerales bacterium]